MNIAFLSKLRFIIIVLNSICFFGQNTSNQTSIILEGYVFDDTCFYEKQGDKCLGREGTEYTDKIKNRDLLKVLDTTKLSRGVYVKLKAVRVNKPHDEEPCICSTKLLINEILEVNTNPTLYEEVFVNETIKSCGKSEYVELNGFLINEFEGMVFYEKIGDTLRPPIWFKFEENLWKRDTLMQIAAGYYGAGGITVKIAGTKYTESPYKFGCRVFSVDSSIEISKIIEVDTTYNLHDFKIEKYRERGYLLNRKGDTLRVFEDFKVGKTYKFKGIEYIDEYMNNLAELDTISINQNIKAKEDYTEDEIIRYAVTIKAIDEITIEVTAKRLDNMKESKTMILISRFDRFYEAEEIETLYESREIYQSYSNPAYDLSIYKERDKNGKMSGHLFISGNDWPWRIDIKEE